jgi:radical SAM-linked protein
MADGIEILEVKLLPDNAGNAMASVAAAKYTIAFRDGFMPSFMSSKAVEKFYSQPEITVTKKTKKSEATFDMKPYIFELYFDEDTKMLVMTVDASSAGNIKPALVIGAIYERNHSELDEYGLLITREETYTNTGTDEAPKLETLGAVGSDF